MAQLTEAEELSLTSGTNWTAPLHLVHGKEDKQVPIEDFYLLIESGEPQSIRFFLGGHMGNIPEIFKTIVKWRHRRLETAV